MAKPAFSSVEAYIEAQPETAQPVLESVRRAILGALPDAEEAIAYNMPVYKLRGETVLYFAAWKHHYSLYPAGPALAAALEPDLAAYDIDKGTIRFPLSQPVPAELIGRIAKFRAAEAAEKAERAASKSRKPRSRRP